MMVSYMVSVVRVVKKPLLSGWALLSIALWWVEGCAPSSEEAQDRHKMDTVYAVPWEQVEAYMKAAPSPVQVALWLRQEKVPFMRKALHDPTLAGKYAGLQGAANLGIYLTDMAYAHATENYQDAYEYLSSVNRLAARYGVDDILSVDRIRLLDKLQDQPDSAQKLLSQYYGELQERLEEMGQQAMLRHMILGGWIESLHIALVLVEHDSSKQQVAQLISLQKSLLPLIKKLYAVDSASYAASRQILTYLGELETAFQDVKVEAAPAATAVDNKGVIQMRFRETQSLSPKQVSAIKAPLQKLRQFVIQS
ncbi:MAG: hypothetical protein NZ989_02500 [Bacteroidia bacterium]|nr:hypothetical protein [Bacteroidia bacterium]MDW8056988.1 hypothetical protein [Bacteroidia bacterium]